MILEGIIKKDGSILGDNGKKYNLPQRGTDDEGYPEVLIDAKNIGGDGWMRGQSIKPYIGMKVRFYFNEGGREGYGYEIINEEEKGGKKRWKK